MKTRWIAVALALVLVIGGALFAFSPNVFAVGRVGNMMGNGGGFGMMRSVGTKGDVLVGNPMHSPEMLEAMRNGTVVDYLNSPKIKEQLAGTPMGEMMLSTQMQEFMQSTELQALLNSDAFKKLAETPQFQQRYTQGGAGNCGFGGRRAMRNQVQGQ